MAKSADFTKWYFATFQRSSTFFNKYSLIDTSERLDDCLKELDEKKYRGFSVISFDCEFVNFQSKPYVKYPPSQRHFETEKSYPTHDDYPYGIVRWILIGSPYGDTFIIDSTKMTRQMVTKLVDFLHSPTVIVCAFNFASDAWAFQLTFGKKRFPFTIYGNMTKSEKASYRKLGILKNVRVFDLSKVMEAVKKGYPGYNIEDWKKCGLMPEGNSLWHLAQSALCIDLIGNDTHSVRNIQQYWNVKTLDATQTKYAQIDAQVTVLSFMVLLRYELIPEAKETILGFPHDYRSPDCIDDMAKIFPTDIEKRTVELLKESALQINYRDGISDLRTKVTFLCQAHLTNPVIDEHVAKLPYKIGVFPQYEVLAKIEQNKTEENSEISDDEDSVIDTKNTNDKTKQAADASETIEYHPLTLLNRISVPGQLPYFISATAPRSRQECYKFLKQTQDAIETARQNKENPENIKKMHQLNWLNSDSQPDDDLKKFIPKFPITVPKRDCLNNFAVSYPTFRNQKVVVRHEIGKPETQLIQQPQYQQFQHFSFGLFTKPYCIITPNPAAQALVKSLNNLAITPTPATKPKNPNLHPRNPSRDAAEHVETDAMEIDADSNFTQNTTPETTFSQKSTSLASTTENVEIVNQYESLSAKLQATQYELNNYRVMYNNVLSRYHQQTAAQTNKSSVTSASETHAFLQIPGSKPGTKPVLTPEEEAGVTSEATVLIRGGPGQPPYHLQLDDPFIRGSVLSESHVILIRDSLLLFRSKFDFESRIFPAKRQFIAQRATDWLVHNSESTVVEMIRIILRSLLIAKQRPALLTTGIIGHCDRMAAPVVTDIMQCVRTGHLPSEEKRLSRKRTMTSRHRDHLSKSANIPATKRHCKNEVTQHFDFEMSDVELVDEVNSSDVEQEGKKHRKN